MSAEAHLSSSTESHYALLRYDALQTGQAALVALNLGASANAVDLDLSDLPPQLIGQRPNNLLQGNKEEVEKGGQERQQPSEPPALANRTSVDVGGYGYAVLVGLKLPRWAPCRLAVCCSPS